MKIQTAKAGYHAHTSVSDGIDVTEYEAQYDASCKRLLSEKVILARILKYCVPEYENESIDDIMYQYIEGEPQVFVVPVHRDTLPRIEGKNTEDKTINEGAVYYDVFFEALLPSQRKKKIELRIDIEAQKDPNPGYALESRMMYNISRLISSQHGVKFEKSEYDKIQKVYSIWIVMNAQKDRANSMNMYSMKEDSMIGQWRSPRQAYDLTTGIMIFIGNEKDKRYEGILKMLGTLFSNELKAEKKKEILEEEYGIEMTKKMDKEVNIMCNLSEAVFQKGVDHAVKTKKQEWVNEGIDKGIEKGIEKGILQERLNNLIRYMNKTHCSLEEAMEFNDLPLSDYDYYAELLKKKMN